MPEYRTEEQFVEICKSVANGNWTQAAKECDDYGFYATDLVGFQECYEVHGTKIVSMGALVILAEYASKYRFTI